MIDATKLSKSTVTTMKRVSVVLTLICVYAVSLSPTLAANSVTTFGLFLITHVLWAIVGWSYQDKPLIWQNVGLIPLDICAMWIRI